MASGGSRPRAPAAAWLVAGAAPGQVARAANRFTRFSPRDSK
jgi:hypothetical protein